MNFFDIALHELEELIQRAYGEDFAQDDLTSLALVEEQRWTKARVIAKEAGCIAGLKFLPLLFQIHDPRITCSLQIKEGSFCEPGAILACMEGPARSILSAERVVLNFLQHLCGVATLTAKCVALTKGTKCQILDTRKTLPGLRTLQKYAVRMGGGTNHRLHLADRILIKNNHLALTEESLSTCLRSARDRYPDQWIEVEISAPQQLAEAIEGGANAVLLDNMEPEEVQCCVEMGKAAVYLEASGGIHLGNLAAYARTGVDGISIGALTHSARALDLALRV